MVSKSQSTRNKASVNDAWEQFRSIMHGATYRYAGNLLAYANAQRNLRKK